MSEQTEEKVGPTKFRWIALGVASALLLGGGLIAWKLTSTGGAGRPVPVPRSITFDGDEQTGTSMAEGQTISIPVEQIEKIGLTVETVGESLEAESEIASANGIVEPNAYREIPVKTLAGGVIRAMNVELGDAVKQGQTIGVLFSTEFAEIQSKYLALSNEIENARRNLDRRRRLVAINHPARTEFDGAVRSSKSAEAVLDEMRKRHARTSKLVEIGAASREELEQDSTKLRTAEAEAEEARKRVVRAESLLSVSQETRTDLEEVSNALRNAESERASMRQRLMLYGMSESRVDSLRSVSQITSELNIVAPSSGIVTARSANLNQVVDTNAEVARVTDLSELWVIAEVFETQLPRLVVGTGASIVSDALPNRLLRGRVAYIDPKLDEVTRTAKVRIELANPGSLLRIGMYVRVAFGSTGDAEKTVPVVSSTAVQNIGDGMFVFVETAEKGKFEVRPVRLGPDSSGLRVVLEGLRVGEKVVTNGSFMLRAELQKSGK